MVPSGGSPPAVGIAVLPIFLPVVLFVVRIPLLLKLHISLLLALIVILNFVHLSHDGLVLVIPLPILRMLWHFCVTIFNVVFRGINASFIVIHDRSVLVYILIGRLVWVIMRSIQVIAARTIVIITRRVFQVLLPTLTRTSYLW